jgi:Reverse transcriptase (RNA-dependent DNA polymerase)/Endonuclease-reverse transcriptase
MTVCLNKNTIEEFWYDAKNFHISNNTYVAYTVLHLNIRSIFANFRSFQVTFSDNILKTDILILSEVNCKEHDVNKFKINGFKIFSKTREEGRGGGLLIYVKSSFNVKQVNCNFTFAESLGLKINNEITVIAIYRKPSLSKVKFVDELNEYLRSNAEQNLIICGDMNIDLLDAENSAVEKYEDMMAEHGLLKLIHMPTREEFSGNNFSSTQIDHIFVRVKDYKHIAAVLKYKISDHYAICAMFYVESRDPTQYTFNFVDFKAVNNDLGTYRWSMCKDLSSPCKTLENCANYIQSVKDAHTRSKTIYTKQRIDKAWITPELQAMAAERCRLFRKSQSTKSNTQYREEYKKYRNKLNIKLKNAERAYNLNCFNACDGNVKKTWNCLNLILGRSVNSIDDTVMRYMGQKSELPDILAGFGKYFVEAPALCSHTCDFVAIRQPIPLAPALQSMHLAPPTQTQIGAIIESLKKKGPGIDKVTFQDVQRAGPHFVALFCDVIKCSIKSCEYPQCLKTALIRPIYKSSSHFKFENYRPIAILSVFDKIFEKYLELQLSQYLRDFEIIDKRQFAFQKGKAANELFGDFADYINSNLNDKKHISAVFFDMKKAFDVLNHEILLQKLKNIGIDGPVLKLIQSYLSSRTFRIRLNNSDSDAFDAAQGVPQGSILGPLLFIIFMNDLFPHIKCRIYIFADDIVILYSHTDFHTSQIMVQNEVNNLSEWCHDNSLVINFKKTVCMHFCQPNMRAPNVKLNLICHTHECLHNFCINCTCTQLEQVENTKYLGLYVDQDFTWKLHIKHVSNKLRRVIREFNFLKSNLTYKVRRIMYFALAHSYFNYGITAWGSVNLTQLCNLQERVLYKMCSKKHKQTVQNQFKFWNVLPASKIFELNVLSLKYFDEFHGEPRVHTHNTRMSQREPVVMPISENKYFDRTYEYIVPRLWNALPMNLKNVANRDSVKRKLRKWFLSNL